MKTIRDYIDLIESVQNPVDKTVRVLPDVGEIGIDSDASPGNGSWYVKLYDGSYDVVGFNSEAEAWRELSSLQDLDTGDKDEQGMAEGFFGDMKQSFATGMADKLKKAIPAEYHKHYDFDSVKSAGDTKAMVARARAAGHLKEQGVAEAQKTDNRPASQFDREIVKAQPDGSCELKCGHKTSAKLSKNPIGKKIFCGRCYELRNKEQGVAEEASPEAIARVEQIASKK
jgi:hypothetical protein